MNQEYNKVLNKIKKHYKNTDLLLEISFENYHHFNLYIRIDYYKKLKKYKISWLDFAHYRNNFESVISYEYLPDELIIYIKDLISKMNNLDLYKYNSEAEYHVHLNSNLFDQTGHKFALEFNRFLHPADHLLGDLFIVIFDNLPRKLSCFVDEVLAGITGNIAKYEYHDEITFDLFTDDLNSLFADQIKTRGQEYYDKGHVFFLEKINQEYIAVVGGTSLYVITIKYHEIDKKMQVSCSCPCEFYCKHLYAVFLAIRANKFRPFYKLISKRNHANLLERVMDFNCILSIGIDDQGNNYLVIENNQIKLLPIINNQGTSTWEILEDDEQETLTNRLLDILNK